MYRKLSIHDDDITPDKAFRMMNVFISRPCAKYALRIRNTLPKIRAIAYYYERLLRYGKLPSNQEKMVKLFIREFYQTEYLIALLKENIESVNVGFEEDIIC